jgi:uncharacterized protein YcbX
MPFLAHISIFPIKSLDGISLTQSRVLKSGALEYDRTYALTDKQGKFVNGKRYQKIHLIRSRFHPLTRQLTLSIQGTSQEQTFHIEHDHEALNCWLSDFFGFPVNLVQNSITGFPDDTKNYGPTVISTATLTEVASWFPAFDTCSMRLRLRTNLEIGGVPPFWEDRLFTHARAVICFQIGDVLIEGTNPCQRCIVPTRDPYTGEAYPLFQKTVALERKELLPSWSTTSRFNHFYRLAVNTRIPASEAGKVLRVGDEVKILGEAAIEAL